MGCPAMKRPVKSSPCFERISAVRRTESSATSYHGSPLIARGFHLCVQPASARNADAD